jgi:hypothetical protein
MNYLKACLYSNATYVFIGETLTALGAMMVKMLTKAQKCQGNEHQTAGFTFISEQTMMSYDHMASKIGQGGR